MTAPREPTRRKTVFDVLPNEIRGYQALLDHLTDIGMEIARQFGPPPGGEVSLSMMDKVEAFERASNAVLVTIRMSHTLTGMTPSAARPRPRRYRPRQRDPEDVVLERPLSLVFSEICIDLASAASIVGIPPWLPSTPDKLRSLIVRLALREAARLEAAGKKPPAPFSAQILAYRPRPSDN